MERPETRNSLRGELENQLSELENAQLVRRVAGEGPSLFDQRSAVSEPGLTYEFKHVLTQQTAYASLLRKRRREIHLRVAQLYESWFPNQLDEHAPVLAEHYAAAGEVAKALEYLRRTGERALELGAYPEAIAAFERGLALLPAEDAAGRAYLLVRLGDVHTRRSEYSKATEHLRSALPLAGGSGMTRTAAEALSALCWIAIQKGAHADARELGEQALASARESGDATTTASALRRLGIVANYQGEYATAARIYEESLSLFRRLGDRGGIGSCLNSLGVLAFDRRNFGEAERYWQEALAIAKEIGDRQAINVRLTNLGSAAQSQGDSTTAARYFEEGLEIAREIGDSEGVATIMNNLGDVMAARGDAPTAERYYRVALAGAMQIEAMPVALFALAGLAGLSSKARQYREAAEWLGCALNHPAAAADLKEYCEPIVKELTTALGPDAFAAAMERGRSMDLALVVEQILQNNGPL